MSLELILLITHLCSISLSLVHLRVLAQLGRGEVRLSIWILVGVRSCLEACAGRKEKAMLSVGGLRSGGVDLVGLGFDRGSIILLLSLGMLLSHRGLLYLLF